MLTAKSNYNHCTQTTQFARSTLSKAPPSSAAQIAKFFHVLDAFFEFQGGGTSAKTQVKSIY